MNYIIFDLEFNQAFYSNRPKLKKLCPFEIIQIGAVKLDENFNKISSFNALIKPKIYKKLHPFVKDMTNITMDQLSHAKPFKEVFKDFSNFTDVNSILCVWGMGDIKELFRNIKYHKLDINEMPYKCINIQSYASKHLNAPGGTSVGLRNAVEMLNIPLQKDFHDAYNDAYYTAEIFKKIYSDNMKIETYDPTENKVKDKYRQNKPKKIINSDKLIKQFEKMYERKLTKEEISMIILSHKMGLTHQFVVEKDNKNEDKKH